VSEVEKLRVLQETDLRIVQIEKELGDIPARKESECARLEEHQASVAKAEEEMKERKSHVKNLELETTAKSDKINKLRTQQLELKTNEAFRACDTEIAGLEAGIKKLEDKELKLLESVEEGRRKLAEATEDLKEEEEIVEEDCVMLDERAADLQRELDEIKAGREAAAADVDPAWRKHYEKLFANKRSVIVVSSGNGVCGGCHMKLPPYALHDAKKQLKIVTCDFCARILY
jgi:predicted  nucleic acid-binding Zn-ribbon protein